MEGLNAPTKAPLGTAQETGSEPAPTPVTHCPMRGSEHITHGSAARGVGMTHAVLKGISRVGAGGPWAESCHLGDVWVWHVPWVRPPAL